MSSRALARLTGVLCLAALGGCDDPSTTLECRSSSACSASEACVDGRCVPRGDASTDASELTTFPDATSVDAPLRDVAIDAVCAGREARAREIRRPIDAIVLPDESPSMGVARDSVRDAMETTFRLAMEEAEIDYQVVWNGTTPLPMLEATGRLVRNPIGLGSGDDAMFKPALDSYDAWRPSLRDDALKVFVHFTDATGGTGASIVGYTGTFDEVLVAREPAIWGTRGDYQFVYHSFVGLAPNTPATLAVRAHRSGGVGHLLEQLRQPGGPPGDGDSHRWPPLPTVRCAWLRHGVPSHRPGCDRACRRASRASSSCLTRPWA
jgi:hypothetical protein